MARFRGITDQTRCSFCGQRYSNVKTLIAGLDVFICDKCVDLCYELMEEQGVFHPRSHVGSFNAKLLLEEWIEEINPQDTEQVRETRQVLEGLLSRLD